MPRQPLTRNASRVQGGRHLPPPSRKTMTDTTVTPPAAANAEFAGEDRVLSLPILVFLAFVIGIVAALGATFFRYLIAVIHNALFLGHFSFIYDANLFDLPTPWGPFVILVPVVGGLIVVWLVETFAPEAKGHGVPEVMFAIYHNKGNVRGIVAVIKSFASALSIGTGASVAARGRSSRSAPPSARRWRASCTWPAGRRSR